MGIARTSFSQATGYQNILALKHANQVPQHAVIRHYSRRVRDTDDTTFIEHVWMLDSNITVLAIGDDIAFVHERLGTH